MCEQQKSLPGYIKVNLTYESATPHTEAALTLKRLQAPAPFVEEIRILIPVSWAFSRLDSYLVYFQWLKERHIVPKDAILKDYEFEDDESTILAYVID